MKRIPVSTLYRCTIGLRNRCWANTMYRCDKVLVDRLGQVLVVRLAGAEWSFIGDQMLYRTKALLTVALSRRIPCGVA